MALTKLIYITIFIGLNLTTRFCNAKEDSLTYTLKFDSYIIKKDTDNKYFIQPVIKITFLKNTNLIVNTDKAIKLKNGDFINENLFSYQFLFNEIFYFNDKKRYNTWVFIGKEIRKGRKLRVKKGNQYFLILNKIDRSFLDFLITSTNNNYNTNYVFNDLDLKNIYINYYRYLGDDIQFRFKLDINLINMLLE